jgi:hypothetical protein
LRSLSTFLWLVSGSLLVLLTKALLTFLWQFLGLKVKSYWFLAKRSKREVDRSFGDVVDSRFYWRSSRGWC